MFILMNASVGTAWGTFKSGAIYDVIDAIGASFVRGGCATITKTPPDYIGDLLARLDDGAGKPCLFLPFCGEYGHEVMSHMRLVHFHRASEKVVCCRPGNEVMYPSASRFVTDWVDPIPDAVRAGTIRDQVLEWPAILKRFPSHHPVQAGHLSPMQEMYCIRAEDRISFMPKWRALKADIVFGIRRRAFAPEKNWSWWKELATTARIAGLTYAVIGARETSEDLPGQMVHSGDYDTDAAVELLQNCRLYVGTDSGGSHLASTVGARMLVFREPRNGMRDFVPRMELVNPGRVTFMADGWDDPAAVAERMVELAGAA